MSWDRFFEDLEDQLDSEWEAERAALETEAERLRLARVTLRERLVALTGAEAGPVSFDLVDGAAVTGRIAAMGTDWVAVAAAERVAAHLVPLWGIAGVAMRLEQVIVSARDAGAGPTLSQRMTFGFLLRDVARRRIPVTLFLSSGHTLSGTIDRAGADHVDLAMHDVGVARRASEVRGCRIVPFGGIAWVRLDSPASLP